MIINIFRDPSFVFGDTFQFRSRYEGESTFWSAPAERLDPRTWKTNFVPDIRSFTLDENPGRGEGNYRAGFSLSNNSMYVHSSEFPPGTYKKVHRHGVGAHVVILGGQGYSLLSFEGEEPRRVDWQDGSVLSPKENEYHQHFNTGREQARYLAVLLGRLNPGHWEGGGMPDQNRVRGPGPVGIRGLRGGVRQERRQPGPPAPTLPIGRRGAVYRSPAHSALSLTRFRRPRSMTPTLPYLPTGRFDEPGSAEG